MSIEAMKLALEVLEELNKLSIGTNAVSLPAEIDTAMDALSKSIAEAEKQEPKREWVGLTDEEIADVANGCRWSDTYHADFANAIEAKLREKNT